MNSHRAAKSEMVNEIAAVYLYRCFPLRVQPFHWRQQHRDGPSNHECAFPPTRATNKPECQPAEITIEGDLQRYDWPAVKPKTKW